MRDHISKCFAVLILLAVSVNCFVSADVVTVSGIEIDPAAPTELDIVEIATYGWIGYAMDIYMAGYNRQFDGSTITLNTYFVDTYPDGIRLPIADRWDISDTIGLLAPSTYSVISKVWVADMFPSGYRLADTLSTTLTVELLCGYAAAGDFNDDCMVELSDFGLLAIDWQTAYDPNDLADMANNWLLDCKVTPGDPACVPK